MSVNQHAAKLSVNVNKLATLRNSRGKNTPDVVQMSRDIISFGADGITVHPRPDGRHIRREDVYDLKAALIGPYAVEFNIEGYPSDDFLAMMNEIAPAQCTLVPDPPEALTSNAGWKVSANRQTLEKVTRVLKSQSPIRVSVFIDPAEVQTSDLKTLADIGVDRIELYTESYALAFAGPDQEKVTDLYRKCAEEAHGLGLGINAGHDLNLQNLLHFAQAIPQLEEVSIGHALIADALYYGMKETIRLYQICLKPHAAGERNFPS
jgi:pyridoxine 5-phosphate synthase